MRFVNRRKDIKGGQFYIRAVINHQGDFWYEVFRLDGKPCIQKEKFDQQHKFYSITRVKWEYNPWSGNTNHYVTKAFCGDLGLRINDPTVRLIRFDHKALAQLEAAKAQGLEAFYQLMNCDRPRLLEQRPAKKAPWMRPFDLYDEPEYWYSDV